jgi:hypothetical protein
MIGDEGETIRRSAAFGRSTFTNRATDKARRSKISANL